MLTFAYMPVMAVTIIDIYVLLLRILGMLHTCTHLERSRTSHRLPMRTTLDHMEVAGTGLDQALELGLADEVGCYSRTPLKGLQGRYTARCG